MWKKNKIKVNKIVRFLFSNGVNLLFSKFCFNCRKEGSYLCQDCQALLDISTIHKYYSAQYLDDLYCSTDYNNHLIKKLIHSFKYHPFVRELSQSLSSIIISHFQLIDNKPDFYPCSKRAKVASNYVLVPVPLEKKRIKRRGFNQAELLAQELSCFLKLAVISNCLIKIKKTLPQVNLNNKNRKDNLKGTFCLKNKQFIKNKNILLIDDVYTTGSTLNECAKVLKKAGAKKVIGIVIARG